jgi:hypothetical protein
MTGKATQMNAADRKSIGSFPRSPGRAAPTPRAAAASYPAGYFSALVREHNWPPRFEPQFQLGGGWSDARRVMDMRERQSASGIGWGDGTIPMPGTPKLPRPGLATGSRR